MRAVAGACGVQDQANDEDSRKDASIARAQRVHCQGIGTAVVRRAGCLYGSDGVGALAWVLRFEGAMGTARRVRRTDTRRGVQY